MLPHQNPSLDCDLPMGGPGGARTLVFSIHVHNKVGGRKKKSRNQSPSPPLAQIPCDHWFVLGEKTCSPITSPAPLCREVTCGPVEQPTSGALAHFTDSQLRQGLHGLLGQAGINSLLLLGVHLLA